MDKTMTQDQRLSFLVEAFKADSGDYQNLTTPKDTSGRQRILNYEKGLNPIYYEEAVKLGEILNVAPEKLLDDYSRFCMPGYGNRIRTIRKLYGLSQVQFAKMTGRNRATISIWEKEIGGHHPNKEAYRRLLRLAEEKGVKINDT